MAEKVVDNNLSYFDGLLIYLYSIGPTGFFSFKFNTVGLMYIVQYTVKAVAIN